MVDYEKGSPGWDISMILARHNMDCDKAITLRANVGHQVGARADEANTTACTCGRGESPIERTRYAGRADGLPRDGDANEESDPH